jgi:hypothetical protein
VIEVSSSYGTQYSRCLPSPEDGNRSSFRNVVLFPYNYLESGRWTKSENPVILCINNPVYTNCFNLFNIYTFFQTTQQVTSCCAISTKWELNQLASINLCSKCRIVSHT